MAYSGEALQIMGFLIIPPILWISTTERVHAVQMKVHLVASSMSYYPAAHSGTASTCSPAAPSASPPVFRSLHRNSSFPEVTREIMFGKNRFYLTANPMLACCAAVTAVLQEAFSCERKTAKKNFSVVNDFGPHPNFRQVWFPKEFGRSMHNIHIMLSFGKITFVLLDDSRDTTKKPEKCQKSTFLERTGRKYAWFWWIYIRTW